MWGPGRLGTSKGAAGQVLTLDDGAVDETGLAVAAVDVVDFVALGFAFRMGPVFGAGGYDAAVDHAVGHQLDCVSPEGVQGFFGDIFASGEGVLAGPVEQFGTIDVTDAGEDSWSMRSAAMGALALRM